MKYKVEIPPPSAKRMSVRKVTVSLSDGWTGAQNATTDLTPGQTEFEFSVPDEHEYIGQTSCNDGPVFDVWVESANTTGSRKEKQHMIPEPL